MLEQMARLEMEAESTPVVEVESTPDVAPARPALDADLLPVVASYISDGDLCGASAAEREWRRVARSEANSRVARTLGCSASDLGEVPWAPLLAAVGQWQAWDEFPEQLHIGIRSEGAVATRRSGLLAPPSAIVRPVLARGPPPRSAVFWVDAFGMESQSRSGSWHPRAGLRIGSASALLTRSMATGRVVEDPDEILDPVHVGRETSLNARITLDCGEDEMAHAEGACAAERGECAAGRERAHAERERLGVERVTVQLKLLWPRVGSQIVRPAVLYTADLLVHLFDPERDLDEVDPERHLDEADLSWQMDTRLGMDVPAVGTADDEAAAKAAAAAQFHVDARPRFDPDGRGLTLELRVELRIPDGVWDALCYRPAV